MKLSLKLLISVLLNPWSIHKAKLYVELKNIWPQKSFKMLIMESKLIYGLWVFFFTSWFMESIRLKGLSSRKNFMKNVHHSSPSHFPTKLNINLRIYKIFSNVFSFLMEKKE